MPERFPFPVVVYVLLPMGFNYVHIQIQSGDCRSELGMPALYQHRVNPIHPLRSTAPRLSVRGNFSERRTAFGRGRRCDSWHRPAAGPDQRQNPESASHPPIRSPSVPATTQKPPLPRPASTFQLRPTVVPLHHSPGHAPAATEPWPAGWAVRCSV